MSDDVNKPEASSDRGPGRRSNRWRNLFIISLALNVFLGGIVAAWALRPVIPGLHTIVRLHHPPPPPSPRNFAERMAERLPEADRAVLRQAFAKRQGEIEKQFGEMRKSQQAARAALRTDPFDAAAYDAAIERDRATRLALQTAIQGAMREAAMGMSAEGRAKLMPRGRPRD
jgi:uncharacterized membrane protein